MAAVGQYTDTDISIDVEGGSLSNISGIHVTFKQGGIKVDVTDVTIVSDTRLIVPLSQVQTGNFKSYLPIEVMLNYFDTFGKRRKSNKAVINVEENLLDRIVKNE